jgi:hypothetical protein
MAGFTYLHKKDFIPKMIYHGLIPSGVPPFNSEIGFASGRDDPERNIAPQQFRHRGRLRFFRFGKMNIPLEFSGPYLSADALIQEFNETMYEMARDVVGLMDEWIFALDRFHILILLAEWREVRIILPKGRAGGADVCHELARE